MSMALQWIVVAAIVLAAGAYAFRTLLPPSWLRALERQLRARGHDALAVRLGSVGGCSACPGASVKPKRA